MTERLVTLAIQNGVADIVLNRPAKRNALSRALIGELSAAIAAAANDPSTRLVVLSAVGPVFCAGMDLDEMQERSRSADSRGEWETDARNYRDLLLSIFKLDVPTLAVVQGPAIAGGFGIVLACDLVLASTQARFALPEAKRGISPAVVSPLLIYRIGAGRSMPLLLADQALDGAKAISLGLCHEVVPPADLAPARLKMETSILSGAPQALAMTKRLVRGFVEAELIAELDAGCKVSAAARQTGEAREGLAAFQEKRSPNWDRPN